MTAGQAWVSLAVVIRETLVVLRTQTVQLGSAIVVEDEVVTRALIVGALRAAGLEVRALGRARDLLSPDSLDGVDLVLLDIELPDGDGYELARWVRERSEAGIIFLSRRSDPKDRVHGLDLGGDDFIVKPPDLDELLARVRAVLRRRRSSPKTATEPAPSASSQQRITFDGWSYDPDRFAIASPSGATMTLTLGEAGVLGQLIAARGRVVARDTLREALSGPEASSPRSLDVIVHRLRRKLGEGGSVAPRILLTVHGVGYRLGVDDVLGD